jgi:hypothetical protein
MALHLQLNAHDLVLSDDEERHIRQRLVSLERRLIHRPEPTADLVLTHLAGPPRVQASLRLRLGPLGPQHVSHEIAPTVDQAVRLTVQEIERQLERRTARQRGEHTYGVPSRRLPARARPEPMDDAANAGVEE